MALQPRPSAFELGPSEGALPASRDAVYTSGTFVRKFQAEVRGGWFSALYEAKRRAVLSAVAGENRQILDLGGGMGRLAIPLSATHFVTLSDLSPQMLDLARPHAGARLRLAVADARALPFPDQSFDAVLCIDLVPRLDGLTAVRQTLAQCKRVLRPGGQLIIDSTNAIPLWTLAFPGYLGLWPLHPRRMLRILAGRGVYPEWQGQVCHYRRRTLLRTVEQAGFKVQAVEEFGPSFCPKWHLVVAETS
jgi:SAM-dependent methyltransferase